jgi:site-specific DNA recombinase
VWAILQNPAYIGKAAFGKTESVERGKLLRPIRGKATTPRHAKSTHRDKPPQEWISIDVPAIVNRDVFDAAKQQLARNKQFAARNARGERYLLQGLTVCAACRYAFYGKTVSKTAAKGGGRHAYYRCVGTDAYRFAGGRVCDNSQVRVDQLDDYVWHSVRELLQNPARMLDEWSRRQKSHGASAELVERRDEAARILATQERGLQRLVDAYEVGAIELRDLKTRSEVMRARIQGARQDLTDANERLRETVQLRAVITQLEDFSARVSKGLDTASWHERRHIVRTLVAKVEIDDSGATVVYRLPAVGDPTPTNDAGPSGGDGRLPTDAESCQLRGRRDHASLRGAGGGVTQRPILHHSRVQPFADQSQ